MHFVIWSIMVYFVFSWQFLFVCLFVLIHHAVPVIQMPAFVLYLPNKSYLSYLILCPQTPLAGLPVMPPPVKTFLDTPLRSIETRRTFHTRRALERCWRNGWPHNRKPCCHEGSTGTGCHLHISKIPFFACTTCRNSLKTLVNAPVLFTYGSDRMTRVRVRKWHQVWLERDAR